MILVPIGASPDACAGGCSQGAGVTEAASQRRFSVAADNGSQTGRSSGTAWPADAAHPHGAQSAGAAAPVRQCRHGGNIATKPDMTAACQYSRMKLGRHAQPRTATGTGGTNNGNRY